MFDCWEEKGEDATLVSTLNPFLPTGQFIAPKLITRILIKCLIDIFKDLFYFQRVVLIFLYVEQDVNLV